MADNDAGMDPSEVQRLASLIRTLEPGDFDREAPPDDIWDEIERGAEESTVVTPSRERWTSGLTFALVGAAAAIVLVFGIVIASVEDDTESPEIIAASTLDLLDPEADARAELIADDGELQLKVAVADLDAAEGGFLELWLIKDPATGEMVSLGPIDGDGRYRVPAGLDVASYSIVDISTEPFDGDPTHSGDSLLRGQLDL